MPADQIQYSERYSDDHNEYRHVLLPPDIAQLVPRSHLMSETEWRNLGVQQSHGWRHYMIHSPEPHVLLFCRPRTDVPQPPTDVPQPPTDVPQPPCEKSVEFQEDGFESIISKQTS